MSDIIDCIATVVNILALLVAVLSPQEQRRICTNCPAYDFGVAELQPQLPERTQHL
ncbi:hypothetical protein M3J09_001121 [Ascochyta lentis]